MTGRVAASALRAVFGSSAAALTRLDRADRSLRAALPVSRRVAFLSAAGGTGCTSAVASVGSLLARRRGGPTLAVDAAGGHAGLVEQTLGPDPRRSNPLPPTQTAATDVSRAEIDDEAERRADLVRRSARTGAEARDGLHRTTSGLYLLDLAGTDRRSPTVGVWTDRVGPIARFYDLVLTDWGIRSTTDDAGLIAAGSHLAVVVGRSDPRSAVEAAELAQSLAAADDDGRRPGLLLLLVDVSRAGTDIATGLRPALAARDIAVAVVPFEASRARTTAPTSRTFAARTRNAHLALADAVVDAVVGAVVDAPARQTGRPAPVGQRSGVERVATTP